MISEPLLYQKNYERLRDALSHLYSCNTLIEVATDQDVQDDYFMDMDRIVLILEYLMWDMYLANKTLELQKFYTDVENQKEEVNKIKELRQFLSVLVNTATQV